MELELIRFQGVNTMKYGKVLLCLIPFLGLAACADNSGITEQGAPEPAALVRFVNAVPDTGTVDFRFVDIVENLPSLQGVALQATSGYYQRTEPGARHARVFPYSTSAAVTQIMLVDTTVTLAAETRYTLVYAGRANGNQDKLAVLQDEPLASVPSPGASIAIRVLHAAWGTTTAVGNVDVYFVPVTSATAATPADWQTNNAGKVSNVAFLAKSAYATLTVRPATTGNLYRFVVAQAGTSTVLFAATPNQPGVQQVTGATYGPQPGMQVAGSVMTAVLIGGAIPGTKDSTTALQSPAVALFHDKVLNPS
ncbi:MAG: DUF4397 domain-containing protein [Gemmatimonadetes bacterium]|nr:DUF4397 domain-containing protein [Gemmatimonadota bacterium]